ncbi:proline and serine-rich protein 3 [Polyodon spathula]|uniref:proline and serine-rich protein 3 n=1 Tax=Polyodon spathula TaxID=7913 RepID=UPI001B7E5102|nr:proline and serine-rich protein 3 [Polyodon spathula]
MKSSALFSNQNPFPAVPGGSRKHYHPSRETRVPRQQQRQAILSPLRIQKSPSSPSSPQQPLSPADASFLAAADLLLQGRQVPDHQASFDESWPSTEHSSQGSDTTGSPESTAAPRAALAGKPQATDMKAGAHDESVLARYIERFRHGRPQSREDRERRAAIGGEGRAFWWLETSPPSSSTPTHDPREGPAPVRRTGCSPLQSPPSCSRSALGDTGLSSPERSDVSRSDPGDPEIFQLQEKAQRLVQRSESSLSGSSAPVSSEGVGSSSLSSPVSADEPVRGPRVPSLIEPTTGALSAARLPRLSLSRARPEEDILFQWRLRRKMELAREPPPLLLPRRGSHPPTARLPRWEEEDNEDAGPPRRLPPGLDEVTPESRRGRAAPHRPCFPVASPSLCEGSSQGERRTAVPPHLHLQCDVLPCTHHEAGASGSREQPGERDWTPYPSEEASSLETNCLSTSEDPPSSDSQPPQQRQATSAESRSKEREREASVWTAGGSEGIACKKQPKKGEGRESSGGAASRETRIRTKALGSARELSRGKSGQKGRLKEGRKGEEAAPPSPIQSVLGQVVSERLFSPSPSPPPKPLDLPRRGVPYRSTPPRLLPEPPTTPGPSRSASGSLAEVHFILT